MRSQKYMPLGCTWGDVKPLAFSRDNLYKVHFNLFLLFKNIYILTIKIIKQCRSICTLPFYSSESSCFDMDFGTYFKSASLGGPLWVGD